MAVQPETSANSTVAQRRSSTGDSGDAEAPGAAATPRARPHESQKRAFARTSRPHWGQLGTSRVPQASQNEAVWRFPWPHDRQRIGPPPGQGNPAEGDRSPGQLAPDAANQGVTI